MDLGFRIKKIHDLMRKQANQVLEQMDVTFSQHHVLVVLMHCEGYEASLKDLEHRLETAQSTMAGIVSRLEDKGFVEGFTDEQDLRIKKVRLTEKGVRICEKSLEDIREREKVMCSKLSEEEITELNRLLEIVYDALKETDPGKENA